jgi:hypothetical protein
MEPGVMPIGPTFLVWMLVLQLLLARRRALWEGAPRIDIEEV